MDAFTHAEVEEIGHSPIGGSAMHRIIACPGSVGLSYGVDDDDDDTYSLPGTAAHAMAELCLRTGEDAWKYIGLKYWTGDKGFNLYGKDAVLYGLVPVDKEMADAVQVYIDAVRETHPERNQGNSWIEREFYCPTIHKFFWGTSDFVYLTRENPSETYDVPPDTIHIWDFKYGAGIMVEVERNPQAMYYAAGILEDLKLWDHVQKVVLHICQPRGYLEPHRSWALSTDDLAAWLEDECVPAMNKSLVSRDTVSGEHCRFCPTRYRACPQLMADMKELEKMIRELEGMTADELSSDDLAKMLRLVRNAKIVGKAGEQTAFKRLSNGKHVDGCKLVAAKSNREWKEDLVDPKTKKPISVEKELAKELGDKAYSKRELLSPAQVEKLPGGKELCTRFAFKPDKGLTLVFLDDARPAVSKDTKSLFKPVDRKKSA